MKSKVFFIDLRASQKQSFVDKIGQLMASTGVADIVGKREMVAVKLHFGELGNTAFIRPVYLRKIVQEIKAAGGLPFLTDANTLYAGTRSDAVNHMTTAVHNGFAYSVVEAPLVIADGLRGKTETAVPVNLKNFQEVYIGSEIVQADCLISVAHFKGHELSGFGGAIKNLGMGCASRRGKMAQHSTLTPKVVELSCIGCGDCEAHCAQEAIAVTDEIAAINPETCVGCGECIVICPNDAVQVQWNQSIPVFLENMVEYTAGVLKGKTQKALHLNFITNVSPGCDCYAANDAPIVADIGVAASIDPVALDQASADLVNQVPALAGTCLKTNTEPGGDKFTGLYPKVDWPLQLEYAEELGIGTRVYELVKLD
ncbi:MAG: DUF362 domain-containing protein [Desulfobacteraceae bacterium]|nr:DUF362 domain-containing protein [Desulfobacteraceae bacterium]